MHTAVSGVAHYLAKNDDECLAMIRRRFREFPVPPPSPEGANAQLGDEIYRIVPADHRLPYEMEQVISIVFDQQDYLEFQPAHAPEMLCANARLAGRPVALIANRRGFLKAHGHPRIGGIIYTESARKVSYFVEMAARQGLPLVYLQDVSGFMVGPDAEQSGIIRAGAEMVESMACAGVPKIVLTLNHASGAGYYAMAGQGFDPDFIFSWPTGRMGVMEGDSAVQAVFGSELERLKQSGQEPNAELEMEMQKVRQTYERDLDAKYAAARGFVDAVIAPDDTRDALELALRLSLNYSGPHLGQFVLPAGLA